MDAEQVIKYFADKSYKYYLKNKKTYQYDDFEKEIREIIFPKDKEINGCIHSIWWWFKNYEREDDMLQDPMCASIAEILPNYYESMSLEDEYLLKFFPDDGNDACFCGKCEPSKRSND